MLTTLLYNGEIIIKHNFFTVYIYYFLPTRPTTFNPTTQTYTASIVIYSVHTYINISIKVIMLNNVPKTANL